MFFLFFSFSSKGRNVSLGYRDLSFPSFKHNCFAKPCSHRPHLLNPGSHMCPRGRGAIPAPLTLILLIFLEKLLEHLGISQL